MSFAQLRTYLQTDEAKKDLVKKAREAGYEVVEKDLEYITGGLAQVEDLILTKREAATEQRDEAESSCNHWGPNWGE